MKVKVLEESGYNWAMLGTSLSREQPLTNMPRVCENLASKNGGHNKFLEFIVVWVDITAPRYWWQQMSTYRIGSSWLSESTMYTITKKELTQENFESPIPEEMLNQINQTIKMGNLEEVKNILPEGFLQRRIMVTNYKALKNIVDQRHNHKLSEWRYFCKEILSQLQFSEFLKPPEAK